MPVLFFPCELGLGLGLGFSLRAARVHTHSPYIHARNMPTPCRNRKRVDPAICHGGKGVWPFAMVNN